MLKDRTQISLNSFNRMYNKKAHMLNIFYSLKTINFFKIKIVVLKHGVSLVYLEKSAYLKYTRFKITQTKATYLCEFY